MPVILALLHTQRVIRPLNEVAITRTQLKRKILVQRYQNAELIFQDGTVRPVINIEIGKYLDSLLPYPFGWITLSDEREVYLKLGQAKQCDFNELRSQVLDYLISENRPDEWIVEGENWETFIGRVRAVETIHDLFSVLHLNTENSGLDMLS